MKPNFKNLRLLTVTMLSIFGLAISVSIAQQKMPTQLFMHTDTIYLNEQQTTSLAFEQPILQVDRGSADLLAQRSDFAPDLLQLKAAKADFLTTNLSVLCQNGVLHCITVAYCAHPKSVGYPIAAYPPRRKEQPQEYGQSSYAEFTANAQQASQCIDPSLSLTQRSQQIEIALRGLFIRGEHMYFHFSICNRSYIPYDVERLSLSLRDSKRAKRTAFQEIELSPSYVSGSLGRIASRSSTSLVLVYPKMTLAKGKHIQVRLGEQGGSRHIQFRIKNKHLQRAIPLIQY